MDHLRLFLLDQGISVEYELDIFNTPHTGTTLFRPSPPKKLAMSIAMSNSAPAPSEFTSGQHFLETFMLLPETNQKHKLTVTSTSISSNSKHDFATYGEYNPSYVQQYMLLSLYFLITPFRLFTCFLSHKACSTNANSIFSMRPLKTIIKTFRLCTSLSLFYIPNYT